MLVASDTSPISNLAIIGRLDLLRKQFYEVWIPSAVKSEVERLSRPAAADLIRQALSEGWIKPHSAHQGGVLPLLRCGLDRGEAEVIALATELRADLVLMDERIGRDAAQRAGLRVTGVLGVLLRAKRDGDVTLLKPVIEDLRTEARFFISARLEQDLLKSAGE